MDEYKNKCGVITKCYHHSSAKCKYFRPAGKDGRECLFSDYLYCTCEEAVLESLKKLLNKKESKDVSE